MRGGGALAALCALCITPIAGSPAPIPSRVDKQLWISTPESTQGPPGVPEYFLRNAGRRPQPPSGAHLPAAKDHPATNEQDGHADFNGPMDAGQRAPGYQPQPPSLKGVLSALDPTKQSPLDTGAPIAFASKPNSYLPNTALFDTAALRVPLQTNRWWQNLILDDGSYSIHPYPYVVRCYKDSALVGFPEFSATSSAVTSSQAVDWKIGDGSGGLTSRLVTANDALGVEVMWLGSTQMRSRFYKGMPFQTFEMAGTTPVLSTDHGILKVELLARTVLNAPVDALPAPYSIADMPSLTKVTLNNGAQWLIASKPEIRWAKKEGHNSLQAERPGPYKGFIQLAHLGDKPDANLDVLQQYAGTYATEGTVTYAQVAINSTGTRSANVVYTYKTNTDGGGDSSKVYSSGSVAKSMQLLSFLLPHHVDLMDPASLLRPGLSGYRSAKGVLTAVAGNIISYNQPLEDVGFEGRNKLSQSNRDRLQRQLAIDAAKSSKMTPEDPYFFGKSAARVARLYQIANELGDSSTALALRDKLIAALTSWLKDHSNPDVLVYDSSWGGIVSTRGLADGSADFGQGRYNDHHFHYGYFVYAGAVLAKHDITAFAPLREPMTQLLRDYASPTYTDTHFPYMRNFDPYDGHSWAAGLFSFWDGRNQESTGEAVNSYYAAYLYAKALGYDGVADFYEIVLNMEATSGRRYWHPTRAQSKELYGDKFVHNSIGIIWSSKADYATFFGANSQYIYGIQMLPFTPATELLIKRDWVQDAWCPDNSTTCAGGMKAAATDANLDGWAQFLYTAYSLVNPDVALDVVLKCAPDDGNTNTNAMYWVLTSGQRSYGVQQQPQPQPLYGVE
ncbi:hypothetical protein H4R18_003091 [Coemansia javaensis]|uniref:glucan endo-1,3-beta-D-glucosidase n=1 Tax=Coemansia javaensis TaxID=2761396 RepID=A0A9W8HA85_9FUNG|nr:hypothetical protein H4R18_003091 [Coemansia javaensis]